jgi:hypothetical protein
MMAIRTLHRELTMDTDLEFIRRLPMQIRVCLMSGAP